MRAANSAVRSSTCCWRDGRRFRGARRRWWRRRAAGWCGPVRGEGCRCRCLGAARRSWLRFGRRVRRWRRRFELGATRWRPTIAGVGACCPRVRPPGRSERRCGVPVLGPVFHRRGCGRGRFWPPAAGRRPSAARRRLGGGASGGLAGPLDDGVEVVVVEVGQIGGPGSAEGRRRLAATTGWRRAGWAVGSPRSDRPGHPRCWGGRGGRLPGSRRRSRPVAATRRWQRCRRGRGGLRVRPPSPASGCRCGRRGFGCGRPWRRRSGRSRRQSRRRRCRGCQRRWCRR